MNEWTFKAIDRQAVIKVLARCTVRVGVEDVIDRVFNNADAQTERAPLSRCEEYVRGRSVE